jgi:iron complex outermembrane receptor protein
VGAVKALGNAREVMSARISTILFGAASVFALTYAEPAPAQQGAQPAATGSAGLEEVVVTARRREEKLQSVPVSVTVFTGAALEDKRIQALNGLQYQVPSLAFRSVGRDSNDIVNLRGLTGVVTYLNEVPLGGVTTPGTAGASPLPGGAGPGVLYDLDSVQVLKGPQGTLFGRNTTGGAILLQARKPTNEFEGYAQVQLGNYNDHEFEGAVNIPIIEDKLLIRFAANIAQRDGFTRVLSTPTGPKDLDSRDFWAERLSITMRPTDDFENDLLVFSNYKHQTGTGAVLVAANPKVLPPAVYAQAQAIIAKQQALGPRTLVGSSVPNSLDKTWNIGVLDTARWDISDNLTLKNIAAYIENKVTNNHDLDGSPLVLLDQYNQHGWQSDVSQWTEEIQLQGKALDEKLNVTGGGFLSFFHPATGTGGALSNSATYVTSLVAGVPRTVQVITTELNAVERSQALFAQAEYDFSGLDPALEGLKFTAGYRYTWDWRSVANGQFTVIPALGLKLCSQFGADKNCVVAGDGSFHAPSYVFGLDYQIDPTTLVYVKTSKGYQSGGFNLLSPIAASKEFKPEYLKDVEVGLKADWNFYGIKARTNIDWYKGWYDAIQESIPVVNPLNGTTVTLVTNAATADLDGVEFEGTIYPFDGLELNASYSYNHTQFSSFVSRLGDFTGGSFLYAPKNKYSLSGRYHFPIDESLGDLSVSATWNWQGHVYLGFDTASPYTTFGDVKTLDVTVDWKNVAGRPIDLSFFMNNALDAVYSQGVYALYTTSGYVSAIYGEPRMWGFKLRYRFGPGLDLGL